VDIGKIIKNRRGELGLTLEQVGKAVGVGKSTVKKWESGFIANMRRDKIAKLAEVLQIDPFVLISEAMEEDIKKLFLTEEEEAFIYSYRNLNYMGKMLIQQTMLTAEISFGKTVSMEDAMKEMAEQAEEEYRETLSRRSVLYKDDEEANKSKPKKQLSKEDLEVANDLMDFANDDVKRHLQNSNKNKRKP